MQERGWRRSIGGTWFPFVVPRGVRQSPCNVGWQSAPAALGSSDLARTQRKVGDCFGEVGERAAVDLGDVPKPRAIQRRACFILPTASWQDIGCFDGKSAVLLDVQPGFASHVAGPAINERWSRDPIPGWHGASLSLRPRGGGLGRGGRRGSVVEKACREAGDAGKCGFFAYRGGSCTARGRPGWEGRRRDAAAAS